MPNQDPQLLAKMAVDKVMTRYQQALQNVVEDIDPADIDDDEMLAALYGYSDNALDVIARETANNVLRAGRAAGLQEMADEMGSQKGVWRRTAVLDENTCGPCDAADGTPIDGPDADLSSICEGGDSCRCLPFMELP
ncbi:MAG: hypothetical protein WBA09_22295 [Candidatus Acidiferrum sp.]